MYWLGRYVERAENTARLLDGTHHLSLLPIPAGEQGNLWRNLFQSELGVEAFTAKHYSFSDTPIIDFMALDPDNPSSIR